jgi:bifunctional UDP-N-acetylglucosamine pyrophosphorylase/glucosamine-1-phosphate N-acetyltransferase
MTDRTCLSIVLAAGEGTRMKSNLPKVLHQVAGLPLVSHVVKAVQGTGKSDVALVVGRGADEVRGAVEKVADAVSAFEQKERLGTAHAVLAARAAIERGYDDLLIVFGDTPLIEAHSLQAARNKLSEGADVVVIGFRPASPHGYGRLIEEGGKLTAIIEEKEASEAQKKISFCNGGLMAVRGSHALALLDAVDNKNAKGEYYLTDIVGLAHGKGLNVVAIEVPVDNVIGINNRAELAEAENIWQNRKRQEMMLAGVTLIAPENVFFSHDTLVETDVVIEPNVFFGQGVHVASGALIHAFSHIEGARLRPGANLGEKSKVGNFCEVKNAQVGKGAKINHLTYIGDATVGASSNIGAGTITCNYDGYNKYKTVIGENAFVGSNSSLVAPVSIGDNAYIASGSTITDDVPADALAFGRARQETKEGRGKILREKYAAIKAAKTSSK